MSYDENTPTGGPRGYVAPRCVCGHTSGEHKGAGGGFVATPKRGVCLVPDCDCLELRDTKTVVELDYTNHRGERGRRRVVPEQVWFGTSSYHADAQWFLRAWDTDRRAVRDFALKDVHAWQEVAP